MNINYNKSNKSIEIKDALKIISFNQLVDGFKSGECDSKFIWCKSKLWFHENNMVDIRTISIVILYNSIFKKTGMDKIPIDQIKGWISGFS
jgi:hypothetical protein